MGCIKKHTCDVISERDSGVNECKSGGVDAGAVISTVGLEHFHENVDLGPRVKLSLDSRLKSLLALPVMYAWKRSYQ